MKTRLASKWRGNRNVGYKPWLIERKDPLMRSSFAWFFSFYNQPGLTDGYKWFPLPFPFQWWAWAIVIASRRLSRSSKRKWKPGRHKEERENECMIDLSFLFYLIDHAIIHFSSSFMCLLARLMIGTVKKRLSLDPAKLDRQSLQCLSSSLDSYHLLEQSFLFL